MKAPIFQVTFMKMLESSFSKFIIFRSKIYIFKKLFFIIFGRHLEKQDYAVLQKINRAQENTIFCSKFDVRCG